MTITSIGRPVAKSCSEEGNFSHKSSHQLSPALIKDNLVPVVTPLISSGDVDVDAIDRLVRFHASTLGTRALFTVGGLGRFFALTDEQRVKAAEAFITSNRRHGSKIKIFTGATSETSDGALSNIRHMKKKGADAIFIAPLYFLQMDEISSFVCRAREALGPDLPLLLYNNPDFSRMCPSDAPRSSKNLDPAILRSVADNASAVKDSSADPSLFSSTRQYHKNLSKIHPQLPSFSLGAFIFHNTFH
mmetsp:Transcript_57985/g.173061  ORF Transcript_57985/g.173061 Transcript_57985/m.173061 type:complete len:246 (-) Transcript_57985:22-759(-)